MNQESAEVSMRSEKRKHDTAPSAQFAEFMKTGWAPTDREGLQPLDVVTYAYSRRQVLSAAFPGTRIVINAGGFKVRANDTDYNYRPDSAFVYYSGVQGCDATADAVLILEPNGDSHLTYLYMHPRSTRDTDAFYRDVKYGELWVGRRFTLAEAKETYQIDTRNLSELESFLADGKKTLTLDDDELLVFTSEQRLCKDEYEIQEMQKAVDATALGFNDVIHAIPAAVETPRGERVLDAAFYGRARIAGNDLGYNTIIGAGSHACVLHWIRNDGEVRRGELVLVDAGVELDSFYTADITRTLPVDGKFSPSQRALYMLVYEAQLAGFAAIKPGVLFSEINKACQAVLAQGLADMGVLTVSAEESLKPEVGLHRRWTLHGVSHHLGLDVHDCSEARRDMYMNAPMREGMVLTVEPGLYIQPDDELFAPEYRGIGIRIEDDIVVTADGYRNLSENIPRHPDE
ncbi:MAG: M24 family metallopeptidase, partial [Actinobacteria bacterium]|nr:M24 family metallopeptidase [Actinomycetota bacterium]